MKHYLVPAIGLTGVTTLATVLIVLVILRAVPGMGMIFKPDTHSNLWEQVDPDYDRTALAWIGGPVDTSPMVAPSSEVQFQGLSQVDLGERWFSSVGCAMCHGLQGQGSVIAPPVAGTSPQLVQAMVRFGPGGMPAFDEDQLSSEGLENIIAYLDSLAPKTDVTWVSATPSPGSQPTTPTATPPIDGDEHAEGASPEALAGGQTLFVSTGCAACHGQNAEGGVGPALAGLIREQAIDVVRSGGNVMPAFSMDKLSEEDLAAIVTYLRSLNTQGTGGLDQ